MKKCDKRKLALACKKYQLITRYKRLYKINKIYLCDADLCGADLCGANLCDADLCCANLCCANLRNANLYGANLYGANLYGTNLYGTNLRGANLCDADLCCANLCYANLRNANLYGANLYGANLCGANLCGANLCGAKINNIKFDYRTSFFALECPEEGSFIGWKKCQNNVIVKLLIPAEAKRSSATTRKCRAEFVDVLDIFGSDKGVSCHYSTVYRKGERVVCDKWDENRWNECSGGIHFFITRQEAENY